MHRERTASLGLVSRILTLAMLTSGLLFLPPVTGAALAVPSPPAPATGHIDEFPVTTTTPNPIGITAGPDGNLWFADQGTPASIGRMSTTGTVREFPVGGSITPLGITSSGGNLWFTDNTGNAVVTATTAGAFGTPLNSPTLLSQPMGITPGPGGVWFTEHFTGKVGRVTPSVNDSSATISGGLPTGIVGDSSGVWFTLQSGSSHIGHLDSNGATLQEFLVTTTAGNQLGGITVGPDNNIWFTQQGTAPTVVGAIYKMTPAGVTTTYAVPTSSHPDAIASGPDGNIWFTDSGNNAVVQMNTSGVVLNQFTVPSANAFAAMGASFAAVGGITAGPDGNMWFTEQNTAAGGGKVGRLLIQPTVSASPTSVNFGNVPVGTTSTVQPVTLTASGGGGATVTAVSASPGVFVATNNCTGGVPPSGSCTIGVTFSPTTTGAVTGTLTVTTTASTTPITVSLTGTGTTSGGGGGPVPVTGVTPQVTNFFNQALGTTSTAKTITLGNAGPGNLTVSGVLITGTMGADFKIAPGTDTCTSQALAPQGRCTVGVVFAPTAKGSRSAAVVFNTSAGPLFGLVIGRGVQSSGYWLSASDGGIFSFGPGAVFYGSTGSIKLNQPIVGMAATPDSGGYWEVATDGGIFAFGNAGFFGSTGSFKLNKPIVGMAPTPTGLGYWLVASDGGIFAFGDALFYGSAGSIKLNKPIVGMASTPDGGGYWLVATDGGIFSYGTALFYGSTGSINLNKPIVGMGTTPSGLGYWLVASDGGIFTYGDGKFFGSTGSIKLNKPIVGMASTPTGAGYWLVATDGGIFSYGDAFFYGSTGSITLNKPIVGMAPSL